MVVQKSVILLSAFLILTLAAVLTLLHQYALVPVEPIFIILGIDELMDKILTIQQFNNSTIQQLF